MYVAVFICFSTKAVHLELLKDLTSNSFILCLSRFVGRRGPLDRLYCDNATNFVGSSRLLQEMASDVRSTLGTYGVHHQVEFVFIPPRSPHFGGLWEAAVKSAKHLFLRAVGNALLKEDEVQTILVEVEAVLNSRPLVADSSNPNDGEAITPAHFLVGTTLAALPPGSAPPHPDDDLTHLQRWQLISAIKRRFWRDWSRDYIAGLQQRVKWTKESRSPHFGGLWEAAVKSAKHLFLRTVGNALLNEDEVQTILVEVEAVLNSHPLIADSSNPNDGEAITPAHFLVGTTLAALPPGSAPPHPDDDLTPVTT